MERACEEPNCKTAPTFQVQFNDPWDFFFACQQHLCKLMMEEFANYTEANELPHDFVITKYNAL
jgi:hypothetical protein